MDTHGASDARPTLSKPSVRSLSAPEGVVASKMLQPASLQSATTTGSRNVIA